MFRASSAHLQEETVVYMQLMVLSLSMRVPGGLSVNSLSSSCVPTSHRFEPQVLIFRRIQLYTCSIWYCHSVWEFLVACRYTAWAKAVYRQATRNYHREWQYHMLHVYNCILLKMSTWGSKHVEENSILWINNQCIKLVINTRVGTLIVATIYLQLIQNRYMFRSFTVLQCSHQHCVQPVASDVEVVGYL